MTDRIVCTDATGAVGVVTCAEYPSGFYGPLPPRDPANAAIYARLLAAGVQPDAFVAPALVPPDCLSLPWWRTALKLWIRTDAASGAPVTRYSDVDGAIKALETAANAAGTANVAVQRAGILAREQFEYANTVLLADLLKLAPAFGFTPADCAESLWRADRVRQGDLTGTWPLPTAA